MNDIINKFISLQATIQRFSYYKKNVSPLTNQIEIVGLRVRRQEGKL